MNKMLELALAEGEGLTVEFKERLSTGKSWLLPIQSEE